jgi:tRNA nucleotidyltransferase (CCA-adding enzyme)
MLLILTHENADFDAVAAQFAAYKLYPEGLPLLSRRVNRNVNQFLTLYWDVLPFMRPGDWQRRRIERVLLVDTQSLPSVRGLHPSKTAVQVIDHHEPGDLSLDWRYQLEKVGATTTILVEMLQKAGLSLTAIEATLLLLGIYEDTGSLTYDTTTKRDAAAVAWLLEQGAQLPVVRRFLNITLSTGQQNLYHQLQESAEWLELEGQTIVLAAAVCPDDFDDEISAVAHRLRDALSPDALLLLVQIRPNHIQLVARSASDRLDVAQIAQAFGGGGHNRAAAATITDRSLNEAVARLRALLPQVVKPAAKVGEIMSYGVQTLTPDTSVAEAAVQMQRFGHEGYPVVDSDTGQLVGLLTRRAVDRALNHKMERQPISQIMRTGQVTVRPDDSIEKLQRLMMVEGWGQVPVVAAAAEPQQDGHGRIIGIVTRTDLLNLLSAPVSPPEEQNYRRLLAHALPPALWSMVQVISQAADELGMPLYFVGGLVRDLILGKSPLDVDMVVEGEAIKLARQLREQHGGEIHSHERFGTAKWLLDETVWQQIAPRKALTAVPQAIDFVTARTEFYTQPTALPEVERSSIKLDLHRRDFSINTLAIRLDGAHLGKLLDFYGGRRDLQQGIIRVLHSLSFIDDPTRILRAVRLEQRLGFTIEPRTAELLTAALPLLDRVTGDRIRHEIQLAMREANPAPIMARLAELGVLAQIHSQLSWSPAHAERFQRLQQLLRDPRWQPALEAETPASALFALWLLPLPLPAQEMTMIRLKVRKTTRDEVLDLSTLLDQLADLPETARPSAVVAVIRPFRDQTLLTARAAVEPDSRSAAWLDRYQQEWRQVKTATNGRDLLALGLKPGPRIGRILERLLTARLDGEISTDAEEQASLEEILTEDNGH